jgi:hypothetical protein
MLWEHARGRELEELISNYGGYEGDIEGRLKPSVIWLLHCLAQICTGERCYKLDFLAFKAYTLMRDLTVGGSLGTLLSVDGLGVKSISKLMTGGVRSFDDLAITPPETLLAMGLRKQQVTAIRRMVLRHTR